MKSNNKLPFMLKYLSWQPFNSLFTTNWYTFVPTGVFKSRYKTCSDREKYGFEAFELRTSTTKFIDDFVELFF